MFVFHSNLEQGIYVTKRACPNAFCPMCVFSSVCVVRTQKKLIFPKRCCVPASRDCDNESARRREVVAILRIATFSNGSIHTAAGSLAEGSGSHSFGAHPNEYPMNVSSVGAVVSL